jgi:hypothetical protein
MLASAMMESAHDAGFEVIDTHLEPEGNTLVRAETLRFETKAASKHRVYRNHVVSASGCSNSDPDPGLTELEPDLP